MAADVSQGRQAQTGFQKVLRIQIARRGPHARSSLPAIILFLVQLVGDCHGDRGNNWTIYNVAASWNQAWQWCQDLNQSLVVLDNEAQQTAFKTLWEVSPVITTLDIWMGVHLRVKNQSDLVSATTPCRNLSYANWAPTEPNLLETDFCIRVAQLDKTWKTFLCSRSYAFACESKTDSCWFEVFENNTLNSSDPSSKSASTTRVPAASRSDCQEQCLIYSVDGNICTAASYRDSQMCHLLVGQSLYITASQRPAMTMLQDSAVFVKRCYHIAEGTVEASWLTGGSNPVPKSHCFSNGSVVAVATVSTSSSSGSSTANSTSDDASIAAPDSVTASMPSSLSVVSGLTSTSLTSSTAVALSIGIEGESGALTQSGETPTWTLASTSWTSLTDTAWFTSVVESTAASSASSAVEAWSPAATSAMDSAIIAVSSARSADATELTSRADVTTSHLSVIGSESSSSIMTEASDFFSVGSGSLAASTLMDSSTESALLEPSWSDVTLASLSTTSEPTPGTSLALELTSSAWTTGPMSPSPGFLIASSASPTQVLETSVVNNDETEFVMSSTVRDASTIGSDLSTDVVTDTRPLCLCRCPTLTSATMVSVEEAAERHRNLLLNKSLLSSTRRKLTSAPDHRVSAAVIGRSGIAILVSVGVVLALPDVIKAVYFLKTLVCVRTGD